MARKPDRYAIVWTPANVAATGDLYVFQSQPEASLGSLIFLANRLRDSLIWNIDAGGAKTVYGTQNVTKDGQPSSQSMLICGYFVVKDTVDGLMRRTQNIDLSKVQAAIPNLPRDAFAELDAHTTFTFAPIQDIPASILLVWAKRLDGDPKLPVEFVMDVIFAYNKWAYDMTVEGVLLDAGRLNVRHDATHILTAAGADPQVASGAMSGGRVTSLISYSANGASIADTIKAAGFPANTILEVRTVNAGCSCNGAMVPRYELDPRNTIYV